jgi:TonB family protein
VSTVEGLMQAFWHGMTLHLWQTTLALAVVLVLARLLRNAPAKLHSCLWTAGLLKFFLPLPLLAPLTGWLLGQFGRTEAIVEIEAVRTAWQAAWIVAEPWSQSPVAVTAPTDTSGAYYLILTILWLMASLALGFLWWSRFRRRADLLPAGRVGADLRSKVAATAEQVGLPPERVFLTDSQVMPCVLGLRRATLVLPRRAAEQLNLSELRAIFAHETAHMRRQDVARAVLQRAAVLVFFFYPPLWLVLRHLNRSAELACDELVLDSEIPAETYAAALAKTLRLGLFPHHLPALSDGGSSFVSERLERIRQPGRSIGMFRHKIAVVAGFFAIATLSILPLADLDLAAAETPVLLMGLEASAPAQSSAQDPLRVGEGEGMETPEVTRKVDPAYPDEAKRAGLQGTVVVEVIVDEKGHVEEAQVVEAIEDAPMLSEATLVAIRQWEFAPTMVNGAAVKVLFSINVRYRLH